MKLVNLQIALFFSNKYNYSGDMLFHINPQKQQTGSKRCAQQPHCNNAIFYIAGIFAHNIPLTAVVLSF